MEARHRASPSAERPIRRNRPPDLARDPDSSEDTIAFSILFRITLVTDLHAVSISINQKWKVCAKTEKKSHSDQCSSIMFCSHRHTWQACIALRDAPALLAQANMQDRSKQCQYRKFSGRNGPQGNSLRIRSIR